MGRGGGHAGARAGGGGGRAGAGRAGARAGGGGGGGGRELGRAQVGEPRAEARVGHDHGGGRDAAVDGACVVVDVLEPLGDVGGDMELDERRVAAAEGAVPRRAAPE